MNPFLDLITQRRQSEATMYPPLLCIRTLFVLNIPCASGKSSNGWRLISSTGISPLRGSLRAALIGCDGFITLDLWLNGSIFNPFAHRRTVWNHLTFALSIYRSTFTGVMAYSITLLKAKGMYLMNVYSVVKVHRNFYSSKKSFHLSSKNQRFDGVFLKKFTFCLQL